MNFEGGEQSTKCSTNTHHPAHNTTAADPLAWKTIRIKGDTRSSQGRWNTNELDGAETEGGEKEEEEEEEDKRELPIKAIVACVVLIVFGMIYFGIALFFMFSGHKLKGLVFFIFSAIMWIPGIYYFVRIIIMLRTKDEEKRIEIQKSLPKFN